MTFIHDIIIVGAGPSGLALATRLCERTPAEHYTDAEHSRYYWIRQSLNRNAKKSNKNKQSSPTEASTAKVQVDDKNAIGQQLGEYKTLILDASDSKFLSRWDHLFETYNIDHLRSPMFFHCDPADRDGLLAYAQANGRFETECDEIEKMAGRELSKHQLKKRAKRAGKVQGIGNDSRNIEERDRHDFYVPSRELFRDHCQFLVDRYKLDEERLILKDIVSDIQYGLAEDMLGVDSNEIAGDYDKIFKVSTHNGLHYARAVVLAIGPSMPLHNMVIWPESSCHSSQINEFPSRDVQQKIRNKMQTNVLVVGGGLTSAQIALRAIGKGVSKVYLIMRGPLKIKHFDLTDDWVGKFKVAEKAKFFSSSSDEERFDMIKKARNGGSIPRRYVILLEQQVKKGRLVICQHTTLRHICKNDDFWNTRHITTEPPIPNLPAIDYIYFATGPRSGLNQLQMPSCCTVEAAAPLCDPSLPVPFLESMQKDYPIHWLNGLPVLSNDMAWSSADVVKRKPTADEKKLTRDIEQKPDPKKQSIPLFMTGALAALRLGPGAANLEGARTGAERVTWAIQDSLGTNLTHRELLAQGLNAYIDGASNMFDGLAEISD